MSDCRLTTFDNPYDPFEQFALWMLFDNRNGYNTCGKIDRLTHYSDDMSEKEFDDEHERVIDEIIDNYLKHITDIKPITARQCIKLLPIIARDKPELRNDILSALHKANICIYDDSMQPLVYKDIQKALKEIEKL